MDKIQESSIYKDCANVLTRQPLEAPCGYLQQQLGTMDVLTPFGTPWTYLQHRIEDVKSMAFWRVVLSLTCRFLLASMCADFNIFTGSQGLSTKSIWTLIFGIAFVAPKLAAISCFLFGPKYHLQAIQSERRRIEWSNKSVCRQFLKDYGTFDKADCPKKTIPAFFNKDLITVATILLIIILPLLYGSKRVGFGRGKRVGEVDALNCRSPGADNQVIATEEEASNPETNEIDSEDVELVNNPETDEIDIEDVEFVNILNCKDEW